VSERPRILVVEDDWVLAEVLCVSLLEAGFEPVGPAPSVAKVRHLIGTSTVDATILEVRVLDGQILPVASALRGDQGRSAANPADQGRCVETYRRTEGAAGPVDSLGAA
jgi:DNA-binding response OmpR family regulator